MRPKSATAASNTAPPPSTPQASQIGRRPARTPLFPHPPLFRPLSRRRHKLRRLEPGRRPDLHHAARCAGRADRPRLSGHPDRRHSERQRQPACGRSQRLPLRIRRHRLLRRKPARSEDDRPELHSSPTRRSSDLFRVVATNSGGSSQGADQTFTTLPDAPAVQTDLASAVTQTGATLNASVNPHAAEVSDCRFEYGATVFYEASQPDRKTTGPNSTLPPPAALPTSFASSPQTPAARARAPTRPSPRCPMRRPCRPTSPQRSPRPAPP